MSKIHILDVQLSPNGTDPNEIGTARILYHVNIDAQKNTNVPAATATEPIVVQSIGEQGRIKNGTIVVGFSQYPDLLDSAHPDFNGTAEATLLASQSLAEVLVTIQLKRSDSGASIASYIDGLYSTVQTKTQEIYTQRFQYYGNTRNPA